MTGKRGLTIEQRFWNKVDKMGGPDACWPWTAGILKKFGYGRFGITETNKVLAHRFAYQLTKGNPGDLDVCHKCDNPRCCNPSHLFLGTNQDNVDDKVQKGRQATGERVARYGESHGMSKLSWDEVSEIRAELSGPTTQKAIARKHGVSPATIIRIKNGSGWK